MEQVLALTSPETFTELYEELFKGRLLQFAAHPKANFVLQRLISSCKEKEMVILFNRQYMFIKDTKTLHHIILMIVFSSLGFNGPVCGF